MPAAVKSTHSETQGGRDAAKCLETSVVRLAGTIQFTFRGLKPAVARKLSKSVDTSVRKVSANVSLATWNPKTGEPGSSGLIPVARLLRVSCYLDAE